MTDSASNTFHKLAETARRIARTRGTADKVRICAEYFRLISDDDDLKLAARFLGEGAFPVISEKRVSVGSRTISTCAAEFCEISYDQVFKPSRSVMGSTSETIEKLMQNIEAARKKRTPCYLTLPMVEDIFERMYQASSGKEKKEILWAAWTRMSSVEIRYFIRILRRGTSGIGLEPSQQISAIADAFNKDTEQVHYVHMITGSIEKTAVLSKNGMLERAAFKLFHPLTFMPASPITTGSEVKQMDQFVVEENFDGMRCQAHINADRISLFSGDQKELTQRFPDVEEYFLTRNLPGIVLDGVLCVFKENVILPSQLLQRRIEVNKPSKKHLKELPVIFIAFDILYWNDQPVMKKALTGRRKLLETVSTNNKLAIANQFEISSKKQLKYVYERALRRGNLGLILKRKDSPYDYGQIDISWLKVKQPGGTLDTVIMYAHAGTEKQNGSYSHYTLGIRVGEDNRYEEEYIPIGKVSERNTEVDTDKLNDRINDLAVERYGPTLGLIPEVVVEVEFDDILVNKRTKANYVLHLPRIRAVRWDLASRDADTLSDVERMYHEKINRKRLKQEENPSFLF